MVTIAVIVTGDPITSVRERSGDFAALIRRAAGSPPHVEWQLSDARNGLPERPGSDADAVIITGSPSSVSEDTPWMRAARSYVVACVGLEVPTLGICFGHQLIASALGGRVIENPRGREVGVFPARAYNPDPVLMLPTTRFWVPMAHGDTVERLPSGAVLLAGTEREPHAALRFATNCWGVQFHPEFSTEVMQAYLVAEHGVLASASFPTRTPIPHGGNASPLLESGSPPTAAAAPKPEATPLIPNTPEASASLTRFLRFAARRRRKARG